MRIPSFPECDHDIVQSLFHLSDQELVRLLKHHPDSGRYFTAIFCRYSPIVYSLIRHSARSPVQADYLFAITWRHILHELSGLDWPEAVPGKSSFSLQSWLINVTALCINQVPLPDVEEIHYAIEAASPPLWCYLERALDNLPPIERLMVVMAQTFHWSATRIAAYLQAEGERLSPEDVKSCLQEAYRHLEEALPADIRAIYLGTVGANNGSQGNGEDEDEILLDQVFAPDQPSADRSYLQLMVQGKAAL